MRSPTPAPVLAGAAAKMKDRETRRMGSVVVPNGLAYALPQVQGNCRSGASVLRAIRFQPRFNACPTET
jgi:hypothetical protein